MKKRRIAKEILLLITFSVVLGIIFFVTDHFYWKSFNIENALNYKIERAKDSINVIRENDDYRKYEFEEIKKKGNVNPILEKMYEDVESRELNKSALNKQLKQIGELELQITSYKSEIAEERFSSWRKFDESEVMEISFMLFLIVYPLRLIIELVFWCVKTLKKEKPSS